MKMFLLFLFALGQVGCRESATPRAEILDFGIYTGGVVEAVRDAPETATGRVIQHRGSVLNLETTRVPAELGVVFGFTYRVVGMRDDTPLLLRYRWTTPGVTLPGRPTRTQEEFDWGYTRGTTGGHLLRFEEEWELVPGVWRLDVLHEGTVLAHKSFKVFVPEVGRVEQSKGEVFRKASPHEAPHL